MIDQTTGEMLLVWTIRLSMICYLGRLLIVFQHGWTAKIPTRIECIFWTLGCTLYIVHVVCAFAFAHDWSHKAALDYTAIETERIAGVRRGEGIWVNYLFTAIWIADATRLVIANRRQQKTNRKLDWAIHGIFGFIVFNATVVFGPPLYRWAAIAVAALLAVAHFHRKRQ